MTLPARAPGAAAPGSAVELLLTFAGIAPRRFGGVLAFSSAAWRQPVWVSAGWRGCRCER
ncbi:MAG: hypothetical protein C0505_18910 [Leptothrix sp. (in: Bacteria)]|nr:hypothetical protein [Leptothrix sp. (in: b-proteobacteria)]